MDFNGDGGVEFEQQAAVVLLPRPGLVTSDSPTLMGILTLGKIRFNRFKP